MTPHVTFFCGSLEPGRDGVGDYTRALASELSGEPRTISAVALSDRFVDEVTIGQEGPLETLRLPFRSNLGDAFLQARVAEWVDEQSPDWLSLQFVCWSHGPHGVPWKLGPELRRLGGGRPWHVMFHELWVDRRHGLKSSLIGVAQQRAIKRLLKSLDPAVVHTSLDAYRRELGRIGQPSRKLPLFGNIRIDTTHRRESGTVPRLVFFGSPPTGHHREATLLELGAYATHNEIEVSVIGGDDSSRAEFVTALEAKVGPRTLIRNVGFLSDDDVSLELSRHDVGVSRMTGELAGKSGTTVAMLEHGLAIWAPLLGDGDLDVPFRGERVTDSLSEAVRLPTVSAVSFRPHVSREFVADLRVSLER